MQIVIVGISNGKRRIMWMNLLVLGTALCLVLGFGMSGVFRLLSGRWNHYIVIYGAAIGIGMMAMAIINGFKKPSERLTKLD